MSDAADLIDSGAAMFEHWHEFYLLLGTAAAALVALLFVAASIGAGYLSASTSGATRTYISPVVAHYTAILFFSLVALVPSHSATSIGLVAGTAAIFGLGYSIFILVRVHLNEISDLADRLGYGLCPAIAYAAILGSAVLLYRGLEMGPDAFAGALILLLVANIRNAWDLMMSLVRRHAPPTKKGRK